MPTQQELRERAIASARRARELAQQVDEASELQTGAHAQRAIRQGQGTQETSEAVTERRAGVHAKQMAGSVDGLQDHLGEQVQFQNLNTNLNEPPLPVVGDAPSGVGRQGDNLRDAGPDAYIGGKQMEEAKEDDYEAAMAAAGYAHAANPNHVNQPPRQPPSVPPNYQPPSGTRTQQVLKEEHPILMALRRDFGITGIKTEDIKVDSHNWTIGMLDAREIAVIQRICDSYAMSVTEREMILYTALAAVCVRAIDGEPVYKVFGVAVPPGAVIEDPMLPPRDIRFNASLALFYFLLENAKTKLAYTIYEAYKDKLDDKDEVNSYLNDAERPRYRYRSSSVDYEFVDFPMVDANGEELPYYCKLTGAVMEKVSKVVGGDELPL